MGNSKNLQKQKAPPSRWRRLQQHETLRVCFFFSLDICATLSDDLYRESDILLAPTAATDTCAGDEPFFPQSSELDEDVEVGVMGTEFVFPTVIKHNK